MNITIKTTGIDLTPALDQYTRYKVSKIGKYIDESEAEALAEIELGKTTDHHKKGEVYRAEINLQIPGEDLKRVEAIEYDLYASIVTAREEMVRQVKTSRDKKQTLNRKGGRKLKDMLRMWR